MSSLRKILNLLYGTIDILGINALFRYINRKKAIVLWYHGICDDDFRLLSGYDERHVPVSKFRRQLEYLKRKGYRFATMTEFCDLLVNRQSTEKIVVLTFDDGFENIVSNAYPVLKEYDARGCFYLVHDLIGTENLLWTDLVETAVRNNEKRYFELRLNGNTVRFPLHSRKMREAAMRDIKKRLRAIPDSERRSYMPLFEDQVDGNAPDEFKFVSWDQVKAVDKNILEIGSHTMNHPNLTSLTEEKEFALEIAQSGKKIGNRLNRSIEHFCYPAGAFDTRVVDKVRSAGYKSAVSTIPGFAKSGDDPYLIKRVVVTESFAAFKAYVSGFYLFLRGIIKGKRG